MAAPGDPQTPDDHDDLIGFTSPSSLTGAERRTVASDPPAPQAARPDEPDEYDDRDLFDDPPRPQPARVAAPPRASGPAPAPASDMPQWARETSRSARPAPEAVKAPPLEGAMGLYVVYAMILCAVPTLGASAAVGLLAVLMRPLPDQPLARSHALFQKRTLVFAAIGAVVGVVLIAFNLGVFVLFGLALWVLVRGAAGAMRLASGRPIANPNTLFL